MKVLDVLFISEHTMLLVFYIKNVKNIDFADFM